MILGLVVGKLLVMLIPFYIIVKYTELNNFF